MEDLIHLLGQFPCLGVSLPSMRPGTLTPPIIQFIRSVRKTGFTIAPEAGTQRLRDLINKRITEEEILSTADHIFQAGWEGIKLYYMIGLPSETDSDVEGIVQLTRKIHRIARRYTRRCFVHIGISTFTPKPHTPFQWHPQEEIGSILDKVNFLKKNLAHRDYSLKWQKAQVSFLEGVLSLGNREEAKAIYKAFLNGCRFDGWTDLFRFESWKDAFSQANLDPQRFLYRQKEFSEILPWDHLETGVNRDFLWQEYQQSFTGKKTPDCRYGQCSECGICDTYALERQMPLKSDAGDVGTLVTCHPLRPVGLKSRLRLSYKKTAPIHFLSHLDMARVFLRAIKRVSIPVSMSQGFHPHPKIAFGPALSVGMESECEYIDIELDQYMDKELVISKLNQTLPAGVSIMGAQYIKIKSSSLTSLSDQHSYQVIIDSKSNGLLEKIGRPLKEATPKKISEFLKKDKIVIRRGKKDRLVDIKPYLKRLALTRCEEDRLEIEMVLKVPEQGSINPRAVLVTIFDLDPQEIPGIRIIRTSTSRIDPMTEWDSRK
jgi:radical SAM-linked protein